MVAIIGPIFTDGLIIDLIAPKGKGSAQRSEHQT